MNRKEKKKSAPQAVIPYRSFDLEPLPPSPQILRLNGIVEQIQEFIKGERKKVASKERSKLRAIFRGDDQLWQKREAWIQFHLCCRIIVTGYAEKLFNLTSPEQHYARSHFEMRFNMAGDFYFQDLAKRWKAKVVAEIEDLPEMVKLKRSLQVSEEMRGDFNQYIADFISILTVENEFDRYCWPQLPEKHFLKTHLQTKTKAVDFERFLQLLWALPKSGKHAFVEWIHIKPDNAKELFEQEQGLSKHLETLLARFKKTRPTKEQIEKAERKKRYEKARELALQYFKKYRNRSVALHHLILKVGEPGYSENYRAKGNAKIRNRYDSRLRNPLKKTQK